ncbi:N-methyl-L-tryptophan oxidase [Solwaraspora sp. WMMB335]|uniref:N-methyl-L-tryptophan oxidase n=1 Tax=Solwaraspora sp. WMMB335 TaxID=3404118 RepID=UPI003B93195F
MDRWDADVVVVGLGAWGASALWQLAERGVDVVGLERFRLGHGFGSSTPGGTRMFRLTSLEHPDLAPLARRSLTLWRMLEKHAAIPLLDQCGGLLIGPKDGVVVRGTSEAAARHAIDIGSFTGDEAIARWPQHHGLAADDVALWEPSAGLIRATAAVTAAVRVAGSRGARVYAGTRVESVEPVAGGVAVHTSVRTLRAKQAVLTTGAWLSDFLPEAPLSALRFPVTWFRPATGGDAFALDRLPVFMRQLDAHTILWGNGYDRGGEREVKLGVEAVGTTDAAVPFDLAAEHREVRSDDWSAVSAVLPATLPGLEPVPARSAASLVSATPDGQFLIGRPRRDPRLVVAGGCNAHGFKHATAIGEAIADLVTGRTPRVPLGFASPDRF